MMNNEGDTADNGIIWRTARAPTFLIVGSQKCGTTSLYHNLAAHPEIGMHSYRWPGSSNEVHYFDALYGKKSLQWYFTGFPGDKLIVGEKSSGYAASRAALMRIAHHTPNTKLIYLVRDPIKRFASHLNVRKRQKRWAHLTLQCILEDPKHYQDYVERGVYINTVAWLPKRMRANLLIIPVDQEYASIRRKNLTSKAKVHGKVEQAADGCAVFEAACHWIGVDPAKVENVRRYHVSEKPLQLMDLQIERLTAIYDEANKRLFDYIGQELQWTGL